MENNFIKAVLSLLVALVVISCGNNSPNKLNNDFYSIELETFNDEELADKFIKDLSKKIKDSLFIQTSLNNGKEEFKVYAGKFDFNFDAGEKAHELFRDSIISGYKIVKGDSIVTDVFGNILFLGYKGRKVGLYSLNLFDKSYKFLWGDNKKNIISVNNDNNYQNIYFMTADKKSNARNYPFFANIELYKFQIDSRQVKTIDKINSFFQVFTNIGNDGVLRISYLDFDSGNLQKINKTTGYYSADGIKVESKYETFDVIKDGMPNLATVSLKVKSPKGKYFIDFSQLDGHTKLFCKNLDSKENKYITSSDFKVLKIDWSNNERYAAVYLEKLNNDMITDRISSLIIVYDTKIEEMKYVVENSESVDFIFRGDYLIYEQIASGSKKITIYDLDKSEIYHEVETKKGCGLKSLKIIE